MFRHCTNIEFIDAHGKKITLLNVEYDPNEPFIFTRLGIADTCKPIKFDKRKYNVVSALGSWFVINKKVKSLQDNGKMITGIMFK